MVSPPTSSTPTARPPRSTIRSTSAFESESAPASRAASAIAAVTRPMPPRTKPQARASPVLLLSAEACSCSRRNAVPGVDGPEKLSTSAVQECDAMTCSDSNHSERYLADDVVSRKARSWRSRRDFTTRPPSRARLRRSARLRTRGSGAVSSYSGMSTFASRARWASKAALASASLTENLLISA